MNTDPRRALELALTLHRAGQTDEALALASPCLETTGPIGEEAVLLVSEVLLRAGRISELGVHLERYQESSDSPRLRLQRARFLVADCQSESARTELENLKSQSSDRKVARAASFELVKLLDKAGEHEAAWETAAAEHRRSTAKYPVELLERALFVTAQAATQVGVLQIKRASQSVSRACFLAGMPRSGTSLLEQMLDRHPEISGIGENAIPGQMADAIAAGGRGWPSGAQSVPVSILDSWQSRYLDFSRRGGELPEATWTIDKTVFPMFQPLAVGAVLPGAKVIRIVRDPRDTATSLFLSNFDPSWGWTWSLQTIERVLTAERAFVPVVLDALGVPQVEVSYEKLVESPAEQLEPVFKLLGLASSSRCLFPEESKRVVMTLSNEQVRSPINQSSVGRWRRYQKFFEGDCFSGI